MELTACLYALAQFGVKDSEPLLVYSDSSYAVNTLTLWKNNWKNNGWRRPKNQPVENLTIIQKYDIIEEQGYKIRLTKIAGHAGILGNELADKLATGALTEREVMEKYG